MSLLLLSMGLVPHGRVGAPLRPHLRQLDTITGRVTDLRVEAASPYVTKPDEHAEFTTGQRHGTSFVQTTRTEVLILSWPDLRLCERMTHPWMHDVHSACILPSGDIAVASTGLDSVLILDRAGTLRKHYWLERREPHDFHARFGPMRDFRRVSPRLYKPRVVHPNHLIYYNNALWTTSLQRSTFERVDGQGPRLAIDQGPPHDGVILGDDLVFTTITGHILAYDPMTFKPRWQLSISQLTANQPLRGWCRGIARVENTLYVGMTQLRESAWRHKLRRRFAPAQSQSSQILAIDLTQRRLLAAYDVGNEAGGTIYSITPRLG